MQGKRHPEAVRRPNGAQPRNRRAVGSAEYKGELGRDHACPAPGRAPAGRRIAAGGYRSAVPTGPVAAREHAGSLGPWDIEDDVVREERVMDHHMKCRDPQGLREAEG